MAHIQKRNSRYQARWREPSGKERTRTFDLRIDAERFLTEIERSKLRGVYVDPRAGKRPFAELAADVMAARIDRRETTRVRDESVMRARVLPTFGDRPVNSVMPSDVEAWIARLGAAGLSPHTIRKAFELLSAVFKTAVRDGLIARTPCRDVRLPKLPKREMRFLTPVQIDSLASAIGDRYSAFVLLGAYGGLRFGEMAALRIDEDLDLLRQRVVVNRTMTEVNGSVRFGPPKTAASQRTVALPQFVVESIAARLTAVSTDRGLAFTSPEGGPLRRGNFGRRVWKPAVVASVGEPLRTHDLRHTHVALLIDHGAHPKTIASRLGHTSVKQVLDRYGHLYDGLDEQAADALDRSFRQRQSA